MFVQFTWFVPKAVMHSLYTGKKNWKDMPHLSNKSYLEDLHINHINPDVFLISFHYYPSKTKHPFRSTRPPIQPFPSTTRLPVIADNCPACFAAPKERHRDLVGNFGIPVFPFFGSTRIQVKTWQLKKWTTKKKQKNTPFSGKDLFYQFFKLEKLWVGTQLYPVKT